jgi:hypothetical protein
LGGNNTGNLGVAAFRAALEGNCTLDELGLDQLSLVKLDGVDEVAAVLERNRQVRVARRQKVWSGCLLHVYLISVVLSRCCARAEAMQLRALSPGLLELKRVCSCFLMLSDMAGRPT